MTIWDSPTVTLRRRSLATESQMAMFQRMYRCHLSHKPSLTAHTAAMSWEPTCRKSWSTYHVESPSMHWIRLSLSLAFQIWTSCVSRLMSRRRRQRREADQWAPRNLPNRLRKEAARPLSPSSSRSAAWPIWMCLTIKTQWSDISALETPRGRPSSTAC